MKPVLVLGGSRPGPQRADASGFELHWCQGPAPVAGDCDRYAAAVVIDDCDADTVRRLLAALRLREAGQVHRVALLSWLDDATGIAPRHGLRLRDLEKGVVRVEYQAA